MSEVAAQQSWHLLAGSLGTLQGPGLAQPLPHPRLHSCPLRSPSSRRLLAAPPPLPLPARVTLSVHPAPPAPPGPSAPKVCPRVAAAPEAPGLSRRSCPARPGVPVTDACASSADAAPLQPLLLSVPPGVPTAAPLRSARRPLLHGAPRFGALRECHLLLSQCRACEELGSTPSCVPQGRSPQPGGGGLSPES